MTRGPLFVKAKPVKDYVKKSGHRTGRGFLYALDVFIQKKLDQAVKVHNGSKKTLDGDVAAFIGL